MPWNLHSHWRDAQAWRDMGLPMSTTSNEACKLYDATLTQACGYYDDDSVGGMDESVKSMLEADPDFVMGRVLHNALKLTGGGTAGRLDSQVRKDLQQMKSMSDQGKLNNREMMHVEAITHLADESMEQACHVWDGLLVEYPLDALAIKFNFFNAVFQGKNAETRDCLARVMPYWTKQMPHYGYVMGMYGFGLCETGQLAEAEKYVRSALEWNSRDSWGTHALSHVLLTGGRYKEGSQTLGSTLNDWESCGLLACHNYWHWGLFNIEEGDYETALGLYDTEIGARANRTSQLFDIRDATSLLYRLELQGVDVGDRWHDLYETARPHLDDHVLTFDDVHLIMAVLGDNQREMADKMMQSLSDLLRDCDDTNHRVAREVGAPLCQAMMAYSDGDFPQAVDLMMPVRYKVQGIGGSNAQRDVFNQLLICACLKSPRKQHNKWARQLLIERKALIEDASLTDRWIAKAMSQHIHE